MNVSQIVQYREQVEGQKAKEIKPVEVENEKILNKRKIRKITKYLV